MKDERENILNGGKRKMNSGNKIVMWFLFLFIIICILTLYSHEVILATEYGQIKPIYADELHSNNDSIIIYMNCTNVTVPSMQVITHQVIQRDMWHDWELVSTSTEIHVYIP